MSGIRNERGWGEAASRLARQLRRLGWAALGLAAMSAATAAPAAAQQAPTIWFGAVSNLRAPRGFMTDPDYTQLFADSHGWSRALSRIQVFLVIQHYIERAPESDVRRMFDFLRAHNVGVAAVFGMVDAEGCGRNVEGMVHHPRALEHQAQLFRRYGADVRYIVADEPLTFGHYFQKRDACQFSIEQTAESYAANIRIAKSMFPNATVVDTEATDVLNSPEELGQWFDLLRQKLGPSAPSILHLDVAWDRDNWRDKAGWIIDTARARGVEYGIIFNGSPRDRSDTVWLDAAKSHIQQWQQAVRQRPRDVVIQSWTPYPSHVLPESDPTALTSLVNWYCDHAGAAMGCR